MNTTLTAIQIIDEFLAQHDVSQQSRVAYRDAVMRFVVWYCGYKEYTLDEQFSFDSVTVSDLLRFKADSKSNGSLDLSITIIRKLYAYMMDKRYVAYNPAEKIKNPKKSYDFKKLPLSDDQVQALLKAIDTSTMTGKRDYGMITMMLFYGLRTIEVTRANIEDIQTIGEDIHFKIQGKGKLNKDDYVVIDEHTKGLIYDYLQERVRAHDPDPLFAVHSRRNPLGRWSVKAVSIMVKAYLKKAGIDNPMITAHSLRHTTAVNMVEAGADLFTVQMFLRHKDPRTTEIYLSFIKKGKVKRRASEFIYTLQKKFESKGNNESI